VIRREVTGRADAVRRFLREIQAIAQLNHPNIVLALDAGEVDGRLFFAMEYVEGIDLARLVERSGPVGVGPALEYVRQVALGLQHASERGLVHRDIKPSNLLLSERVVSDDWFQGQPSSTAYNSLLPNHQVKILDMGLARLQFPDQVGVDASSITQVGMVVGTPDFLAPEQAADSRQADIRSDLYSLGCTLYYLLTGTVPFPGGTLMDKLFRHRLELARPVERLRPEVPSRVGWMVRKLMAKCPEERYQTPLELARAVETLLRDGGWSLPARERGRVAAAGPAAEQAAPAPTEGLFTFTPPGAIVALLVSNSGHGTKERRRQAWIVGVVGLLALGWIVLGAILWLFIGGR
jgi:serine/threonine-protein kinase